MSLITQNSDLKMIRRTRLLKLVAFVLCVTTVLVVIVVNSQRPEKERPRFKHQIKKPKSTLPPTPEKFKLFHLDLKGAPPRMDYILKILPIVRKAGANGLLIEYEDMFPWEGRLRNVSARNAYTKEEVRTLIAMARTLDMEIIPLVQTFGHLEFVLKLAEFRHLRELDSFPQEICPANMEAVHLVKEMIRQIMNTHQGIQYLHIGCDEVYHIASCVLCSQKQPRNVFTAHVTTMGEFVRAEYPGVTPIIWDDMMRHWSPVDIEESGLGKIVEPMIWVYIEDIGRLVPNFIWFTYKQSFPKIWAASAYKGAFGEKETLPDLPRHVENHLAWLRIMKPDPRESTVMKEADFRGIALTGWSRYDHFAVLAELIPLAIPSLILNLAIVTAYLRSPLDRDTEAVAFNTAMKTLNCPDNIPFHTIEELKLNKFQWAFEYCSFPGSNVFPIISQLFNLQSRLSFILNQKNLNGWVSEYNVKHNYSSPWRVLELFPEEGFAAQRLKNAVQNLKAEAKIKLLEYYDEHTVKEWIEQKLDTLEDSLIKLEKDFQTLIEIKTWPRRPLD